MSYVLITGSSRGIGRHLAEECAKKGLNLVLVSRSENKMKDLVRIFSSKYKVDVRYLAIDLLQSGAVEELFHWCKKNHLDIRILINNIGYARWGRFTDTSMEEILEMIQLNLTTTMKMCHTFIPMMRNLPNPYILNLASTAGYQPVPYFSVYAASKAAVVSFSRSLRTELKKEGINVSVLCPGPTASDFFINAGFQKKGLTDSNSVTMEPAKVAEEAIENLFAKKAVIIPGFSNRLGVFISKHIGTSMLMKLTGGLFKPGKNQE
ncbi:MAG: SDR family NAD(P)-dependent oxidoreductase [Cyclobacteriaceae bacterium]